MEELEKGQINVLSEQGVNALKRVLDFVDAYNERDVEGRIYFKDKEVLSASNLLRKIIKTQNN